VRWVDLTTHQARLVESPLDIGGPLSLQREAAAPRAWIFTSATLGDDDALSWFSEPAGLQDARKLRVDSPFDYEANSVRLRAATLRRAGRRTPCRERRPLPPRIAPRAARAHLRVDDHAARMRSAAEASAGRARQRWACRWRCCCRAACPSAAMLERSSRGGCVLVGSQSFWEGIDVPGDALQCVLIDKLPFPPPNDPLIEARVKRLQSQGRDAFNDCFVAEAAVSLKQGAGRLIRTVSDRGLLVICDSRLRTARYGGRLLAALPPMRQLSDGGQALDFLRQLALSHVE
jgi:ATP-dependent DNA helicase DinG